MNKNRLLRSSSKLSQSQTSLINQSITQISSIRKQSKLASMDMSQSDNMTSKLLKKISLRQQHSSMDDINKLIPLNDQIRGVYDDFEENYRAVRESNQVIYNAPQTSKIEVPQKQHDLLLKTYDGLQLCELDTEKRNKILIFRFRFYYFRAKLKNKLSPLQIFFSFPDKFQQQIYRVFLSTSVEFPTKFNCEQAFSSRSVKVQTKSGTKFFSEDVLYMTMYAENDFQINIHLVFGEFHNPITNQRPERPIYYMSHFDDKKTPPRNDKILQNLDQSRFRSENRLKEFLKQTQDSAKKIIKVVNRGKLLEQEKQAERSIKLAVKQQIQEFRKVEKSILLTKAEKVHTCKQWVKCIAAVNIVEDIFRMLIETKRRLRIQAKARLLVWQMKTKLILEVRQFGVNPYDRCANKTMMLLKSMAYHLKMRAKSSAQKIVTSFLSKTCLYQTTIIAHSRIVIKIRMIIRVFRSKKFMRRAFRDRFWRQIKNYFYATSSSSSLFQTQTPNRYIQIDKPLMAKAMDEYMNRRKQLWMENRLDYIKRKSLDQNAQKINVEIYQLPNEKEIKQIVKDYYGLKNKQ